jgi:hypothetical protein
MEYVSILPYIWCLSFVKASVVIQFQRTLPVSGRMQNLCIVMNVIIGMVTAAFTLVFSLTCNLPRVTRTYQNERNAVPYGKQFRFSRRQRCHRGSSADDTARNIR